MDKTNAKGQKVKFIRVRGRVVPIRADKHKGSKSGGRSKRPDNSTTARMGRGAKSGGKAGAAVGVAASIGRFATNKDVRRVVTSGFKVSPVAAAAGATIGVGISALGMGVTGAGIGAGAGAVGAFKRRAKKRRKSGTGF